MASPQFGIFAEGTSHHHYLEFAVAPDAGDDDLRRAVAGVLSATGEDSETHTVVAFGAALWSRLAGGEMPAGLRPFAAIEGPQGYGIPSTQRDILVWVHGGDLGATLDGALAAHRALATVAGVELDERGFTYHDSRDLTGFIDGSANPKDEAAREAALIADGETGAGGAFVLSQCWVHDLASFHALAVEEQERIIGRTKPDSIELEGDAMPPDSHVSRTDVKQDGVALKIYRRSAPFGTVGTHGLYFLAFACDPVRFDVQLTRMFGTAGDGLHDRLIEFSRPVTSSYWFAPSRESLAEAFPAS